METKLNWVLVIDDDEPMVFFTQVILEESTFINSFRFIVNPVL